MGNCSKDKGKKTIDRAHWERDWGQDIATETNVVYQTQIRHALIAISRTEAAKNTHTKLIKIWHIDSNKTDPTQKGAWNSAINLIEGKLIRLTQLCSVQPLKQSLSNDMCERLQACGLPSLELMEGDASSCCIVKGSNVQISPAYRAKRRFMPSYSHGSIQWGIGNLWFHSKGARTFYRHSESRIPSIKYVLWTSDYWVPDSATQKAPRGYAASTQASDSVVWASFLSNADALVVALLSVMNKVQTYFMDPP